MYPSSDIPLGVLKNIMKFTTRDNVEVCARYRDEVSKAVNNDELSARERVRQICHLTRFIPLVWRRMDGMTDKIVDLALQCGPNTSAGVLLQVRLEYTAVGLRSHFPN